jgi:hypothetical protein
MGKKRSAPGRRRTALDQRSTECTFATWAAFWPPVVVENPMSSNIRSGVGLLGYAHDGAVAGSHPIYRCLVRGQR